MKPTLKDILGIVEKEFGKKRRIKVEEIIHRGQENLEEHDKHCKFCQGLGYGKKQEKVKE